MGLKKRKPKPKVKRYHMTDVLPHNRHAQVTFEPLQPDLYPLVLEALKPNSLPEFGQRYDSVEDMLKAQQ